MGSGRLRLSLGFCSPRLFGLVRRGQEAQALGLRRLPLFSAAARASWRGGVRGRVGDAGQGSGRAADLGRQGPRVPAHRGSCSADAAPTARPRGIEVGLWSVLEGAVPAHPLGVVDPWSREARAKAERAGPGEGIPE